jgi:hypothetical protein
MAERRTGELPPGGGQTSEVETVVWKGRPGVGPFVILYGILAVVLIAVTVAAEVLLARSLPGASVLTATITIGAVTIPYGVEVLTVIIFLIGYLAELVGLEILRARNKYELRTDGLYINTGIANLENVFISPMAFSDARLIRTIGMRMVGRSTIIVEANDKRRFEMRFIKDGQAVQNLIRRVLSHPTVRIEPGQLVVQRPQ